MRRELNEIEYFNWCVAQPYNMVVSVRVRGEVRPDVLRRALDRAQERHPLLGVNTEIGADGIPWFSSEGVGPIPLTVLEGSADPQRLLEEELQSTFVRDETGPARPPLIRVALLPGERTSELLLTVQHVIADGLSMVFLVRDLLHFMEEPQAPLSVLDAPARSDDLLPVRVRRRIPRTPLRFLAVLLAVKILAWLRSRKPREPHAITLQQRSWELTAEETSRLLARCRKEGVSVQSAICAAFLTGFSAVHTPVNLRPFLARPVGESVGLFVGSADIAMKYRPELGLWGNARLFHPKLRRSLRDPFRIYRLFSKAVPVERVQELGPLLVSLMSRQRPFAVTNLGTLDGMNLRGIESFTGAVTGIVDSSVLTVYTIDGRMRLSLLASESPQDSTVRDDAERAVALLLQSAGASLAPASPPRALSPPRPGPAPIGSDRPPA